MENKIGTIYTDSKYAFGVVHTFGKIWEERGLINTQGKRLVHEKLIQEVLKALRGPLKIAIVHVKGHQKGLTHTVRGKIDKAFTLQELDKLKQIGAKRW